MTDYGPGWLTMAQDDIPGVRGPLGVPGGRQGAPGGWRLLPAPKRVIKQQYNGPKPWFKVPKVCPGPWGMVLIHFWGIWGHLVALNQWYLVKTLICQKNRFSEKIYTSVSTDHLEQKSTLLGVFHTYQYTKYVWKTPKIESHLVIFGCGNAGIRGILFKKNGYFFSKNPKKCKKWKKNIFSLSNAFLPP